MNEQLWTRQLGRQRKAEQQQKADEQFTAAFALVNQTKRLVAIGDETGITAVDADWLAQADYDQTVAAATGRRGY